jgi:hypothetical protein
MHGSGGNAQRPHGTTLDGCQLPASALQTASCSLRQAPARPALRMACASRFSCPSPRPAFQPPLPGQQPQRYSMRSQQIGPQLARKVFLDTADLLIINAQRLAQAQRLPAGHGLLCLQPLLLERRGLLLHEKSPMHCIVLSFAKREGLHHY